MIINVKQDKVKGVHAKKVKHPKAACVRDTEHAVRQCEAQRSTEASA
ncbi:MAG: hypothetical protein NZ455_10340 [Bacteroidia bacterium]|nr:hypothetical protein [Bacteroidia bacterium]MDW8345595.1 hypothetical protein [Bacteroidia bacterium]